MSNHEYKSDKEFLIDAYRVATLSPDPSTQNGAIVPYYNDGHEMACYSCNTFPQFVNPLDDRMQRPLKYSYIEHAERGAIYAAAKIGVPLFGKTMYCPWAACAECARAIICSGIRKVVNHKKMMDATPEHWKESITYANIMFKEAKVEIIVIDEDLPEAPKILFNGKLWQP